MWIHYPMNYNEKMKVNRKLYNSFICSDVLQLLSQCKLGTSITKEEKVEKSYILHTEYKVTYSLKLILRPHHSTENPDYLRLKSVRTDR